MVRVSCHRHHNYKKNIYVGGKSMKKMLKKWIRRLVVVHVSCRFGHKEKKSISEQKKV